MHPVCFRLGEFTVHWFGVFMALAFLAGLLNWAWLGRRRGIDFNLCSDLLFWLMVAGVLGARLAYVASQWRDFVAEPWMILRVDRGGLVYYGGAIAAAGAVWVFARRRGLAPPGLYDLVATSLPLSHALGRVGCFLNGCCHGSVYAGWPGVRFPAESLPWWEQVRTGMITRLAAHSLAVHPVQLYEAAGNLVLYAVLAWYYRRRPAAGRVAGLYLLAYPVLRFLLEFLRGDARLRWAGLTVAQLVSLGLLAAGVALFLRGGRDTAPGATTGAGDTPGT